MMLRWYWYRLWGHTRCAILGHDLRTLRSNKYTTRYCSRCPFTELEG